MGVPQMSREGEDQTLIRVVRGHDDEEMGMGPHKDACPGLS